MGRTDKSGPHFNQVTMKTAFHSLGTAVLAGIALSMASYRAAAQSGWGNALSLDGVDDYVVVAGIDLANTPLTIELWAKRQGPGTWDGFLGQGSASGGQGLFFALRDNDVAVFSFYAGGLYTTEIYTDAGWHHWAVTYDPATGRRLYRDGELVVEDGNVAAYTGTGPLMIGSIPWGVSTNAFGGQIDEVRIWNVSRSQPEIAAEMHHPLTGSESNLVAYWDFDESTGLIVEDATPNGRDGVLTGGAARTLSTVPQFTDIGAGLPGLAWSTAAWGDCDSDGDLDILLAGGGIARVYRNDGGDSFSDLNAGLAGVNYPCKTGWADYDRDGNLDFLLTGSGSASQLMRNNGDGSFTAASAAFPELWGGFIAWGDYDNDGDLDLLLTGQNQMDGFHEISRIYRNDGSGVFTDITAGLQASIYSSGAWGDHDNDGDLDLLLTGATNEDVESVFSWIYRNNGDDDFTELSMLQGVGMSSVAWGDYDNDGDLDILLTGLGGPWSSYVPTSQVYRNNGDGTFTDAAAGLPGVCRSSVAWGDSDNDGDLDILLAGATNPDGSGPITQLWRNTGSGFVNSGEVLPGIRDGSAAWGDYDHDGDLDILLTGNGLSRVYRNNICQTNTPASVPGNLEATLVDGRVVLEWSAGTGEQTSSHTYNLRVGTTPGGTDVVTPQTAANGQPYLPAMGNRQLATSFSLSNLPAGQAYYWSVQAMDPACAGSAFAPECSFTLWQMLGPGSGLVPGDTNGDGVVDQAEFDAVAQNYWGSGSRPYITDLTTPEPGLFEMSLANSSAWNFSVEVSTNLEDWTYLGPAVPFLEFHDTDAATSPQRFYRLNWP